jgi:hypothetical protein
MVDAQRMVANAVLDRLASLLETSPSQGWMLLAVALAWREGRPRAKI